MYDEKKEHGIYAGLKFYEDMCNIRKKKAETQTPNKHLSWSEDLEEVYHSVAWVIMAHNIWYLRDGECDENELKKYKSKKLDYLILNNEKIMLIVIPTIRLGFLHTHYYSFLLDRHHRTYKKRLVYILILIYLLKNTK